MTELLERYLNGETTPAENLRVENWLTGHQNTGNQWNDMDAVSREAWLIQVFTNVEATIDKDTPVITLRQNIKSLRSMI